MRSLWNVILKELIQLRRDPKIVPILFVAPVMQLVILGYAATTDIRLVEMALCDLDRTEASRTLVEAFTSSKYFRVVSSVESSWSRTAPTRRRAGPGSATRTLSWRPSRGRAGCGRSWSCARSSSTTPTS